MVIGRDLPLLWQIHLEPVVVDPQEAHLHFFNDTLPPEAVAKTSIQIEYCKKTLNIQILKFYFPALAESVQTWKESNLPVNSSKL